MVAAMLAGALLAAPAAAFAADADDDPRQYGLGADALMTIPIGSMADGTGHMLGGAIRIGYYLTPRLEIPLRAGYQAGLKTDVAEVVTGVVDRYGIDALSLSLGARYFFLWPSWGPYASAELGLHVLTPVRSRGNDTERAESQERFGLSGGVGWVLLSDLPIHAGAQLTSFNFLGRTSEENGLLGITFLVGYEHRL